MRHVVDLLLGGDERGHGYLLPIASLARGPPSAQAHRALSPAAHSPNKPRQFRLFVLAGAPFRPQGASHALRPARTAGTGSAHPGDQVTRGECTGGDGHQARHGNHGRIMQRSSCPRSKVMSQSRPCPRSLRPLGRNRGQARGLPTQARAPGSAPPSSATSCWSWPPSPSAPSPPLCSGTAPAPRPRRQTRQARPRRATQG